jgi:hypothetical protein
MSDQLDHYYSRLGPPRSLSDVEHSLIARLVRNTPHENKVLEQLCNALVQDMPDGGMGSIKFQKKTPKTDYEEQIAEGAFWDADGVPVSVTLMVDSAGHLFELDVFKADGSPLVRYPDLDDFEIVERHGKLGFPP